MMVSSCETLIWSAPLWWFWGSYRDNRVSRRARTRSVLCPRCLPWTGEGKWLASSAPSCWRLVCRSQDRMLRRRREKTSLILAAIVILFVFCQSLRWDRKWLSFNTILYYFCLGRLVFKMIEISLIEDHVSAEVFNFCGRSFKSRISAGIFRLHNIYFIFQKN